MTLASAELKEYEAFAHELADAAAAITLPRFRASAGVIDKSAGAGFDPVTEADREAEQAMRDLIRSTYPDHGIIGEEFDDVPGERLAWVLDPIDGTRGYISGVPLWGTLIGLREHGEPALGLMSQPYTGERYCGNGKTAELREAGGRRLLRTRLCPRLTEATVCASHPDMFPTAELRQRFQRVAAAARLSRFGGDCYQYCMVALGQVDLVIEAGLQLYDIVPLIPIIEGAGGVVSDWAGERDFATGRIVAAGDHQLHESVVALLNA